MKKRGGKKGIYIIVFSVFVIVLIISSVSAGFSDFLREIKKIITGKATQDVSLNITVGVPEIVAVDNETLDSQVKDGLNAGPSNTTVLVNFTVYHGAGEGLINESSAILNLTKNNEDLRENVTCEEVEASGNYANFTCEIDMWWWDGAGTWTISAYIEDNNTNSYTNNTESVPVGATTGFEISPTALTWASIGAGAVNQTSNNDPVLLNNTGNQAIGLGTTNITVNATNLLGETDNSLGLWAGNFTVSYDTGSSDEECVGDVMIPEAYVNITIANLTIGNYTTNDGDTGQEELYFCLTYAGTELATQSYSTGEKGSWIIQI